MARAGRLAVASFAPVLVAVLIVARLLGVEYFVVRGRSMEPALHDGDLVLVSACSSAEIRSGDVVTWRAGRRTAVTHRVVSVRGGTFTTRGDANGSQDGAKRRGRDVLGRVLAVVPRGGLPVALLHTPGGFLAGIAAPAVLLLVSDIRRLLRRRGSARDGRDPPIRPR